MSGFSSSKTKLYTTAPFGSVGRDDPNYARLPPLVRGAPASRYLGDVYTSGDADVTAKVRSIAYRLGGIAQAILTAEHGGQERSSNPRIEVRQGDRTDWHVLLVTGGDSSGLSLTEDDNEGNSMLAGALSIEYGRRGYTDSKGRKVAPWGGISPLHRAMAVMM